MSKMKAHNLLNIRIFYHITYNQNGAPHYFGAFWFRFACFLRDSKVTIRLAWLLKTLLISHFYINNLTGQLRLSDNGLTQPFIHAYKGRYSERIKFALRQLK